jgi:hypothetical protein
LTVLKYLLGCLLLTFLLAACGAPGPTAASATDDGTGGWVELENDFVLDESSFEKVTPAPVEPVSMSQSEALAQLPFAYAVPTWAPEGFGLQEQVEVLQPASGLGYTSVSLTWLGADDSALYLQVAQADADQPALGAAGDTEAVTVNGQRATLVRSQGLGAERLSLTWLRDGLTYTLTAAGGDVAPEVLQRMAESVP